jgi:hypothetical protein
MSTSLPAIKYYKSTTEILDGITHLDEELYKELEEIGGTI